MNGIVDADTHISEGEAMWKMMEPDFLPRRPIMLKVPSDTWYGNRDAFWLIDGEIYPKPAGKGSFALVTPSAQSVQAGRQDSTVGTREMTDIKNRLVDMDKLNTAVQIVYPTLFLVYNTKDPAWSSPSAAPITGFSPRHGLRRRIRSSGWSYCPCIRSKNPSMRFASLSRMALLEFSFAVSRMSTPWIIPICFQSMKKRKNKIYPSAFTPVAA